MPGVTETAHNKLKDRVAALESASPPSSWVQKNQLLTWLISLTLVVASIFIAIYSGVIPHLEKDQSLEIKTQVKTQVDAGLAPSIQKIGQMSDDLAEIKGTLKAWAQFVTPQLFKRSISLPDKQFLESLPQLKAAAQVASESGAAVPAKDIADVGMRTISLASGNSDSSILAWDTTKALLKYRSYLNSVSVQLGPQIPLQAGDVLTHYQISKENMPQDPVMRSIGASKAADAAQLRTLSAPDFNKDLDSGPSLLVLETPTVILDNLYAKNVVFDGIHIIYRGGPSVLQNVYFLNCTFEIQRQTKGQELANRILSGPVTNFLST